MNTATSTISEFAERLASADPTPGGGAAAAVVGSLAAALVAMVGRVTLKGKDKKNPDRPEEEYEQLKAIVEEADDLRVQLLELADRDAEAFEQVMAAYKLPKATDEEKAKRQETLQEALKGAAEVPYQVAENCGKVLELAQHVADLSSRSVVSDAGTAASLAEAALHSALLNVDINLKYIKDEKFCHVYRKKREDLAKQARIRKDATLAIVEDWIRPAEG